MSLCEKITENIFRIKVPFENIYTSVFIIKINDFLVLLDTATTKEDVSEYIVPALNEMGGSIKYVIVSHSHGDHIGGLRHIKESYPEIQTFLFDENYIQKHQLKNCTILKDKQVLFDFLEIHNFRGHSADSLCVFDKRTDTLLTFDCFQLLGVGRYGTGVTDIDEYFKSIEFAKEMKIKTLVASHHFVPLGGDMYGEERVNEFFDECIKSISHYKTFVKETPELSLEETAKKYKEKFPDFPPVSERFFEIIKEI